MSDTETSSRSKLISTVIGIGWLCLLCSSIFLYFSIAEPLSAHKEQVLQYALWLMASRLFGISAFVIGTIAMYQRYWFSGCCLFIGSAVLPFVSLYWHGQF